MKEYPSWVIPEKVDRERYLTNIPVDYLVSYLGEWEKNEINREKAGKPSTSDSLRADLRAGREFHPIDIIYRLDTQVFNVSDGLTRIAAHRDEKAETIKALIYVSSGR